MPYDVSQILNLVGQLGGDHQEAAQQLQGMQQIDPQQHGGLLSQFGIDPQQLQSGGYQEHFDAQQQPGFSGYQEGQDYTQQQPAFGQGDQGYGQQDQGYGQQDQGYREGERSIEERGQDYDQGR